FLSVVVVGRKQTVVADVVGGNRRDDVGDHRLFAAHNDDRRAVASERLGRGSADSARRSGDDDGFSGEGHGAQSSRLPERRTESARSPSRLEGTRVILRAQPGTRRGRRRATFRPKNSRKSLQTCASSAET